MKKVIFVVMLLLGLGIFSSCEKEGSGGSVGNTLVGSWVDDDYGLEHLKYYFEFTKDKKYISWALVPEGSFATYSNGELNTPAGCRWVKEYEGPYSISDDVLNVENVMYLVFIKRVSNDKLRINWNGDYNWLRVKKVKTN